MVFEVIFKVSSGILWRINLVCDCLMLFGYLSGKIEFVEVDVEEVVCEIYEEIMGGII